MKNVILAAAFLVGISAFANPMSSPNDYSCTVQGTNSEVHYSSTSFSGQPIFTVDGKSYYGRGTIRSESSSLGTLVTVQTLAAPDAYHVSETLLLPTINLPQSGAEVEFDSALIQTTSRDTIAGPKLVRGAVQSYQFKAVHCVARQVVS